MRSLTFQTILSILGLSSASPIYPQQNSTVNPCLAVRNIVSNPNGSLSVPLVPAQLAYDCLNDMPFDSDSAVPWLDSLRPYFEWQTTTEYLKNPPSGYLEPAFDFNAQFEQLYQQARAGSFDNEYQFELALYLLFQHTHDGHFRYLPNAVGGIFLFGRPISLVSYSTDGQSLPQPYIYSDVVDHLTKNGPAPSELVSIDGTDAITFLESWSQYGSLQDPDALYNNVFFELAQATLGQTGVGPGTFQGSGRGAYIYPGPTTTVTLANGTTRIYENFARVLLPFTNIANGTAMYLRYVNPLARTTQTLTGGSSGSATSPPVGYTPRPGYPDPVNLQVNNLIAGYYLTEPGYEDVAVLSVPSFVGAVDYQDTAYYFLANASAAGKTKLIVDLSANGGGTIMQGYNLFLNLFPDLVPYGASRYRAHEAFDIIGETVSSRIWYYPYNLSHVPSAAWDDFAGGSPFNYRADVDIDYQNFASWSDKYGPHEFYGDNFTSLVRWNLSDPTVSVLNNVQVNNYGSRTGMPPSRPFDPENIIVLTDGYCASTCTIFLEFITQQAGVKTVAIGGRPQANAPMQAIGGVEGSNNYPWLWIYSLVTDTYMLAPDQASYLNTTILSKYRDSQAMTPFYRSITNSGQVNVRDNIRQGDSSQTPLQFVYDAADCRLFYTAEMTVDVTAIWQKVADVTWGTDTCVHGSVSSYRRSEEGQEMRQTKRRVLSLSAEKVRELVDAQELWTDLSALTNAGQGYMMP